MQSVEQVEETILSDDNSQQVIDEDGPGVLDEIARLFSAFMSREN